MNWQELQEWLDGENAVRRQNKVWQSRYKSLKNIFEICAWLGCDVSYAESISMSNWETIIGPANIAAGRQDREALEDLFQKAAQLTNKDLSIALFGNRRPVVQVSEATVRGRRMVTITAPEAQFRLIKGVTRASIEYQKAEQKEDPEEHKLAYRVS